MLAWNSRKILNFVYRFTHAILEVYRPNIVEMMKCCRVGLKSHIETYIGPTHGYIE